MPLSVHGSFFNLIFNLIFSLIFNLSWLVVGFNTWFIAEPMSCAYVLNSCVEPMVRLFKIADSFIITPLFFKFQDVLYANHQ